RRRSVFNRLVGPPPQQRCVTASDGPGRKAAPGAGIFVWDVSPAIGESAMPVSQRTFYERQYRGDDYASGTEQRSEKLALAAFVASYGLQDKRVLEMGCGRGAFQHVVRDWFGVDLAASAGRTIRKPFASASVEALPFKDESFDAAWS